MHLSSLCLSQGQPGRHPPKHQPSAGAVGDCSRLQALPHDQNRLSNNTCGFGTLHPAQGCSDAACALLPPEGSQSLTERSVSRARFLSCVCMCPPYLETLLPFCACSFRLSQPYQVTLMHKLRHLGEAQLDRQMLTFTGRKKQDQPN